MIAKLFRNLLEKAETGFLPSGLVNKIAAIFFFGILLFLPTQLGKHFWPSNAYVLGERIDYLSPTLFVTDILIGFLFVWQLINKKLSIPKTVLVGFVAVVLEAIFTEGLSLSWYPLLKLFEFAFLVSFIAKQKPNWRLVSLPLFIGILTEVIISFFQFIYQRSLGGAFYFLGERSFNSGTLGIANASINGQLILRPYGTFSHPNVLSGFLLISAVLCIWLFQNFEIKKQRYFFVAITIVFATCGIFLSLSRIAIVLWVVFLFATAFWYLIKSKKVWPITVLAVLIVLSISLFPDSLQRILQTSLLDESITIRQMLISSSLSMINDHLIFGVGLGNYLRTLPSYEPLSTLLFTLQPVHNIFLLVASETGFLGLILFAFALGRSIYKIIWSKKVPLGVCLFFIFTVGVFDHYFITLQQGQLMFALVLGLAFS